MARGVRDRLTSPAFEFRVWMHARVHRVHVFVCLGAVKGFAAAVRAAAGLLASSRALRSMKFKVQI